MDVKPWEPVSFRWEIGGHREVPFVGSSFSWDGAEVCPFIDDIWSPHITLANGQCIIVRALSEDRKAARAAMKEASQ